jgi:hypothetical protein
MSGRTPRLSREERERRRLRARAHHEAGPVIVALDQGLRVRRATMVPDDRRGGYVLLHAGRIVGKRWVEALNQGTARPDDCRPAGAARRGRL